ncbi:hypothetical protein CAEBREN_29628 [Caenorhabditis brenneri]|uniref:PDEase domain-containing protein n=1 Tax=Caenorhabditis brenneri TaxID=135651 RepID=G0NH72_CAEBE|nr:hypothetical protein CAEBREN_29628 [Caenorhabditis brenneri]
MRNLFSNTFESIRILIEDYIVSPEVSSETFERWSVRRAIKFKKSRRPVPGTPSTGGGAWTEPDLSMKRRVILETSDNRTRILYEITQCCGQLIGTNSLELIVQNDEGAFSCRKTENGELKLKKVKVNKSADYIQTIVNAGNQTIGEIHFYIPLEPAEKQIVNAICTWSAAANYFSELYTHKNEGSDSQDHQNIARQRKLSNFLLDVARSIFHDIVSMDAVIIKVMNFAQKLVDADRASLFLVDAKNKQIYARIFDVGTGDEEHVRMNNDGQKEIRFDMSKGIAGHVASTGDGLNIENAYDDERFNAEVDSKTGYTTKRHLYAYFDKRSTLSLIKHCILATDLALFFSNKAKLNVILDKGEFDINRMEHRLLTQAVMMTGCDLVASAKPWSIQTETVKVIFEEFYDQGDAERLGGKDPIPMMDRNQAHQLPQMQVGFMRGICMPCYELIARIFPKADKMRERCE